MPSAAGEGGGEGGREEREGGREGGREDFTNIESTIIIVTLHILISIPELSFNSNSRHYRVPIPIPDDETEFPFPFLMIPIPGFSPALQGAPATDGVGVVHTLAAAAQLSTHVHRVTEQLQRMRDHCTCTCRFLGW